VKNLLAFAWCLMVLAVTPGSLAGLSPIPPQNSGQDTLMLFARQAEDPIHIVQASFGADNLLLDARLENKSHNKVQTYRIGWAVVRRDEVKIGRGDLVTVPDGIDTTAAFDIPGQGVPGKDDLAKHPTGVIIYVAELQFQDGSKWQADGKKIRKEAVEMVK
jgi:hypothetical protein